MKGYTFVDYATQGYLALVGLLIVLFHGSAVPHWGWLVCAHAGSGMLIQALIWGSLRRTQCRGITFVRHFYPVLLYAGLFAETGWLNQMFIKGYLDPTIIRWDQALFGFQPSLVFMERFPYLVVSEIFYASYFSYYLMIGGVGIALYLRNRAAFVHYVSVVSFVFYLCYLIYIFVPVIGPPIFFRKIYGYTLPPELQQLAPAGYPATVTSGFFYRIMKWIYEVFEAPGAAIPSSHVAVALCTVFFSFRYLRRIRWLHLVVAVLLCLSTIYCRYHYACDVLAGIATAALLIPAANWFYQRFDSGAPMVGSSSRDLKLPLAGEAAKGSGKPN
ncbi:MAG TPA: phosphatase PAP2 family protein [Verrucomicrobiae bacterium]|nr:phosphatase PAP2 family protein [Verrucomicrobiae bacterium]